MLNLVKKLFNQNKRPNIYYSRGFLRVDVDLKYKDADEEQAAYEDSFTRWHEWRKEGKHLFTTYYLSRSVSSIHNTLWRSRVRSFEIIDSLSDRQLLQMNGVGIGGVEIVRAVSAWDKQQPRGISKQKTNTDYPTELGEKRRRFRKMVSEGGWEDI